MTDPAVTPLLEAPRTQEALVLHVTGQRMELRLRPGSQGDANVISARLAIPNYTAHAGDRVLVHSTPREPSGGAEHFVIGVLHTAAHEDAPRVTSEAGAYAERTGATLALYDNAGRLLVNYDTQSGTLELRATADLHLAAPAGCVRVSAGQRIEFSAPAAELASQQLSIRGDATRFDFGRLELSGERLLTRVAEAFVDVERVAETRAKRLRTLVDSTLELFAQRTSIRSEKDTRIDGKRVLLG